MAHVNHHMVCLARDARALTQAELARRLEIGQGTLSKYEAGLLIPPDHVVDQIARVLGYPRSFFHQSGVPYGFPPFHFRKRKKLGMRALDRIVAEMNIRRMHVKKLLHSYEHGDGLFIPEIDFEEYQGTAKTRVTIEDVARHVRESWMVPKGPIGNMVSLIEDHGGIVIPCDFGTDLIDAMSQRIDGMPVLFFVNSNSPADRVRFTLAHELGHMVLHTLTLKEDSAMEAEADHFAGAFLVPADECRVQLKRFDLRHLANLKLYWKVSMQVLATRADQLNLITPYQKRSFWIELGRLGYRKREPNEPPIERPSALLRMVSFHQRKLRYSNAEIAQLLDVLPAEFERMYGNDTAWNHDRSPPMLRVVK